MQKHLQRLLLIVAMMLVPWVTQSQTLEDYTFSTGVDTTKWVDMSTATTILSPSGSDGLASSVRNIGFPFPFGEEGYAQYSVNTDGNLRLGPTVTGTGSRSPHPTATTTTQRLTSSGATATVCRARTM